MLKSASQAGQVSRWIETKLKVRPSPAAPSLTTKPQE